MTRRGDGVLELEADESVVVHAACWITFDPPRHDVALAIVICSFNQPEAVSESLRRLAGTPARVIVVHQGDAELSVPSGVEVVRQPNFGGSGGFARGMIEALDGGATHVLLLDDDVRLDPDLPARLRSLLARLTRPTTIGGQMLDLSRPTVLGASHETVELTRMRLRNPLGGTDLAAPDATAAFARRHVSDYNGWWCCCVPAETVRAALPLPMFVRHDDVEHGLRTTRAGSEVVTMPGMFVWHKPFDAKIKLWYAYYDRRNKLIVAALHGALPGPPLARLFLADCWRALTLHRYDICWAACRGARDFLAGPAVVFSDPAARHAEIVAGVARSALQAVQSDRARAGRHLGLLRSLRLPEVARPVRAHRPGDGGLRVGAAAPGRPRVGRVPGDPGALLEPRVLAGLPRDGAVMVSVVMPVFNGAACVADAVDSVLRQRDVELELLIHDDGSTDATGALLDTLAAADSRIDVTHGPNRGPAQSRNLLLERARADYVAFLDHDDLWPEGRLGRQLAQLQRAAGAPGVMGETVIFETLDPTGRPARSARSRRVLAGLLQAGLFRRSAIAATGPFAPAFMVADDFDFLLRLIESSGAIEIDPEVAVWYRLGSEQWTADRELTGQGTARALAHSLRRRRAAGQPGPLAWREARRAQ